MILDILRKVCAVFVLATFAANPSWANSTLVPTELAEIDHGDTVLTLVSPDGTVTRMDLDQIEDLETYQLQTTTPWRDVPATFQGVRLKDLLAEAGLGEVAEILVTAENDYTSVIPRAVWETEPFLVATRVNGAPISRRARGPILFVIEATAYEASDIAREAHLVWMAARIEPNG